jgi:hypothetical protein
MEGEASTLRAAKHANKRIVSDSCVEAACEFKQTSLSGNAAVLKRICWILINLKILEKARHELLINKNWRALCILPCFEEENKNA